MLSMTLVDLDGNKDELETGCLTMVDEVKVGFSVEANVTEQVAESIGQFNLDVMLSQSGKKLMCDDGVSEMYSSLADICTSSETVEKDCVVINNIEVSKEEEEVASILSKISVEAVGKVVVVS